MFILGEIRGQLSALLAQAANTDAEMKRQTKEFKEEHQRLELRVRLLETSKAWFLGGAAVVAAAASFIVDLVMK